MLTDTEIAHAALHRWVTRYEAHLDQIPQLVEHLRERALPMKAATLSERVQGGDREAPLPFRLDPVDDCDDIWAAFLEYVGEVSERLQDAAPQAAGASWAVAGSIRGIPAWMTPNDAHSAAYALIGWLIDRARKIEALSLAESEDHLFSLIRKLMSRYVIPPLERPARRRLCTVCGEKAVVVDWIIGDTGEAACRNCGATYTNEGAER